MTTKTYFRERRRYAGGRPLPRLLDEQSRRFWSALVNEFVAVIPSDNKLAALVEGVERFEGRAKRWALGNTRAILSGRRGIKPDTAFAMGEGLHEAGIPWASGLLTLALAEPFRGHVIGTVGRCIEADRDLSATMVNGFATLLDASETLSVRGSSYDLHEASLADFVRSAQSEILQRYQSLTWSQPQHDLIRKEWANWGSSREDTTGFDQSFAIAVMLCRLPHNRLMGSATKASTDAMLDFLREAFPQFYQYARWTDEVIDRELFEVGARYGLDTLNEVRLEGHLAGPIQRTFSSEGSIFHANLLIPSQHRDDCLIPISAIGEAAEGLSGGVEGDSLELVGRLYSFAMWEPRVVIDEFHLDTSSRTA